MVSILLNDSRQKTKNLLANPAVSLLILDFAVPYRCLGDPGRRREISPDGDYSFADRVGVKYHADLREHAKPGQSRVVVTIRPARARVWPVDTGA